METHYCSTKQIDSSKLQRTLSNKAEIMLTLNGLIIIIESAPDAHLYFRQRVRVHLIDLNYYRTEKFILITNTLTLQGIHVMPLIH
jgi:hypothetical protein